MLVATLSVIGLALALRVERPRLGLAGGRRRPPRVLARRRSLRGRTASRYRHRSRRRTPGLCARLRRGRIRRPGSDARAHRHDRRRRLQGLADPSRAASREARRPCRGEGALGRSRADRRSRARDRVRPPGYPGRRRGNVRRSAVACSRRGPPPFLRRRPRRRPHQLLRLPRRRRPQSPKRRRRLRRPSPSLHRRHLLLSSPRAPEPSPSPIGGYVGCGVVPDGRPAGGGRERSGSRARPFGSWAPPARDALPRLTADRAFTGD